MIPEEIKLKMIAYAAKAPSGHNTQPWKFKLQEDSILILPDFSRALPVVDPDDHALYISLGCALENLVIAAGELGYTAAVAYPELNGKTVIQVDLQQAGKPKSNPLFAWIEKRQVTRADFAATSVSEDDRKTLEKVTREDGIHLHWFTREEEIAKLEPYIIEGSNKQFRNKSFVNELVSWIRFNEKEALKKGDGIRGASMKFPGVKRWIGEFIMKKLVGANSEAKRWKKQIYRSAGLLLFSVDKNDSKHWIKLGRAFQRFGLKTTALNIKHAHVNMPCEEVSVREKMANDLGLAKQTPLLLIRFGYANSLPYSYRRKLNEIVINY